MGDITKDFSRREFACKCGCGFNKINMDLVNGLQFLRDLCGQPIEISSGCRCESHNRKEGGKNNSFHLRGDAADVKIAGLTSEKIAALAEQVPQFQQGAIIVYKGKNWCHLDVRGYRCRLSL